MREVLYAAGESYKELKNLCVWTKTNAGMGSFYRSQHELVFKNGNAPNVNNVECQYTLREGECLLIPHETEEVRLTKEYPLAVRPISRW